MAVDNRMPDEREMSQRERIDAALVHLQEVAEALLQDAMCLDTILLGTVPHEIIPPPRPERPGWLGEIEGRLERLADYLDGIHHQLLSIVDKLEVARPTPLPKE